MFPQQFEIVATHGELEVGRYTVVPGEFTVGRASNASIPIEVGAVSDMHARVALGEDGTVWVEDLGSDSGTQINDRVIAGRAPWRPGETLRIGDVALRLVPIPGGCDSDDHAQTLSPSQIGDQIPHTPVTPPSPPPIALPKAMGSSEDDVIRRHLPLVSREAQRLEVDKEIARGGMGAVLATRESATRRLVAMKVMLRSDDANSAMRFIEEAQVTAQLEHPNIVPVYDLSVDEYGQPFYTMKLVSGITLGKVLDLIKEGRPETVAKYPLGTLLTIFQKVCDALAFAHSKGVIHRDLKPANIMLGKFGEVLVMDWGLAKIVGKASAAADGDGDGAEASIAGLRGQDSDVFATMLGSVMGTPHYMSPEQARGENDTLDARSDVFTLGVILYEILTLERPFAGRNAAEIMSKITSGEFVGPAQRTSARRQGADEEEEWNRPVCHPLRHLPSGRVPESLDAIVRKAMALDRERRYRGVPELQADLTAYQNGFATSAEAKTAWKQMRLFVRRHRTLATAIAVGLVLLAASSAAFTWRVMRERDRAEAGEAAAKRQTQVAELNGEAAQLVNLAQTDPEEALIRAMRAVEKARELLGTVTPAVQHGLTTALERHRAIADLKATVGTPKYIAVSDASGRVAKFGERNQCELLDIVTAESIVKIPKLGTGELLCAAVAEDGNRVAVAGDGLTIALWQREVESVSEWAAHDSALRALAFEPSSRRLVSMDSAGAVKTWKAPREADGKQWKIEIPGGRIGLAALGGTARTAVVVPPDALAFDAYAVQLEEKPRVIRLRGHTARITAVAVSADGGKIATADADGLARVWAMDGQLIGGPFAVQRGVVHSVAFSPSGDMLAAAGVEQAASVFSLQGTLMHGPFALSSDGREGVAITSDGILLAGRSGRFDLLGLESEPAVPVGAAVEAVVVAPDGSKLAAMDVNGRLNIWDIAERRWIARPHVIDGRGKHLIMTPDGTMLACAASRGREVRFVDWKGVELAKPLHLEGGDMVAALEVFPATGWLVVAGGSRIIFRDARGKQPDEIVPIELPRDSRASSITMAASMEGLVCRVGVDGPRNSSQLIYFDNARRKVGAVSTDAEPWSGHYAWRTMALAGSRALLGMNGDALVWPMSPQPAAEREHLRLAAPQPIRGLGLISDETFASGTERGALRTFTLRGEALTPWLRRDVGTLYAVVPLPDGGRFITGGGDGRVRFWENGVERWMQSAARRLLGSEGTKDPQVAGLIARYAGPPRARITNVVSKTAATPAPSTSVPPGYQSIAGSPLALAVPDGWEVTPADKTAMINRLAGAIISKYRTGEFDIVAILLPKGIEIRDALANATTPVIKVMRINSARTPADVARVAREGIGVIRGIVAGGPFAQMLTGGQVQSTNDEGVAPEWNESAKAISWTYDGKTQIGQRIGMHALILPTRERTYIVAMRAGDPNIEKTQSLAATLFASLHLPPELHVDDAFREALRAATVEHATKAVAEAAMKRKSDEFSWVRDRVFAMMDAKKPEEARKLADQAIKLTEELEKLAPAEVGKWLLSAANMLEGLYGRFHGRGEGAAALDLAQRAVKKATTAFEKLKSDEARTTLGKAHRRVGDAFRMANRPDDVVPAYRKAMEIFEESMDSGLSAQRIGDGIKCALDWAGMEHRRKRPAEANAALERALRLHRRLIDAAAEDPAMLALLFEDGHYTTEQIRWIVGDEKAAGHLGELLAILDAQSGRKGLDANLVMRLARFTSRVHTVIQRQPGAPFFPRKEIATRTLAWLERLESMRPLSMEEQGWRGFAASVAEGKLRLTGLPRPPGATAQQIDLSRHYRLGLDEGGIGSDPNGTLAALPDGLVELNGVKWDIRGIIRLTSKRSPAGHGSVKWVTQIPVGQRVRKLHVLHGVAWEDPDGTEIGHYQLKYGDGQSARLPIVYGRDVRNWNAGAQKDQSTPDATEAWTGPSATFPVRLFHRVYENPRPDAEVATLDFVSADKDSALIVLAITVE